MKTHAWFGRRCGAILNAPVLCALMFSALASAARTGTAAETRVQVDDACAACSADGQRCTIGTAAVRVTFATDNICVTCSAVNLPGAVLATALARLPPAFTGHKVTPKVAGPVQASFLASCYSCFMNSIPCAYAGLKDFPSSDRVPVMGF